MVYRCLQQSTYELGDYHIEPIRSQDRMDILQMRNEQLAHLRQAHPLTPADQDRYFAEVVAPLYEAEQPSQLLFSFFHHGQFVGYGGLVHMQWPDRHAEISFIMKTDLQEAFFGAYWAAFLACIQRVAFDDLQLHKIFTYAFDIRPQLYPILEQAGMMREAVLKRHVSIEGCYRDVVIHALWNQRLNFRVATAGDARLYFDWANDPWVRSQSFQTDAIAWDQHLVWFNQKLQDPDSLLLLFTDPTQHPVGQVRFERKDPHGAVISISIDSAFRGAGLADSLIRMGLEQAAARWPLQWVQAYIKPDNAASIRSFMKAGFDPGSLDDHPRCLTYFYHS